MDSVRPRARFDWLVEIGGASALGLGGAYAALKLAPSFAMSSPTAIVVAGFTFFAIGMLVMRTAPSGPSELVLADFAVVPVERDELLLEMRIEPEELLLDTPVEESCDEDMLLLEDALPDHDPASRVVQLFASPPTPGQLKERIDRHLAGKPSGTVSTMPNASDALYAALDELRRSLR
jgi:hypothetical protein